MADLKACFEKAGYKNVSTLLQTGNVIFESDKSSTELKKGVEATLTRTFNYPAKVLVLDLETLGIFIKDYPFGTAGDNQHDYVIFMENGLEKDILSESYELAPGEKVQAGKSVVYWRVDKGSTLKSAFSKLLSKSKYKDFNTNRNLKTLQKIVQV